MTVIFAKTPKGQEEIEKRGGGLTLRVRRLLIFVDGKRSVEDLHPLNGAADVTHMLDLLEEQGYIEATSVKDGSVQSAPLAAAQQLPAITTFRDLVNADSMSLARARNFMTNTISAFVGPVGTSTLIENIKKAESHLELRAVSDDWYDVIVSSRDDRRDAETLRAKLLEVI